MFFFSISIRIFADKIFLYDERIIEGEIVKIEKGELLIHANKTEAPEKISCEDIACIQFMSEKESAGFFNPAIISLKNKDKFYVSDVDFKGETLEALLEKNKLLIPKNIIDEISFNENAENYDTDKNANTKDVLFLSNNDRVYGELMEISEDKVKFKSNLGETITPVRSEKNALNIMSVIMKKTKVSFRYPVAVLELKEGNNNKISCFSVEYQDGIIAFRTCFEKERKEVPGGEKLIELKKEMVKGIIFKEGNAVYLSDLEPVNIKETSYNGSVFHYKNDKNCHNKFLSVRGKKFRKGLGTHSKCELTYNIPAGFKVFKSSIGIDDMAGLKKNIVDNENFGSAIFRIDVDGKEIFSKSMNGGNLPYNVEIPLEPSCKKIKLIVDFVNEPDSSKNLIGCLGDWGGVRFCKK